MPDKFLTMDEVLERTALSKTEIYRRIKAGTFPRSIPLGRWKVVFLESEVRAWMEAQVAAADAGQGRAERVERAGNAIRQRWDRA